MKYDECGWSETKNLVAFTVDHFMVSRSLVSGTTIGVP
jgi:hypothetical protein